MDWHRLARSPARYFPWAAGRAAWDGVDPNLGDVPVRFAQDEFRARAVPCPACGRVPDALAWIALGTSDAAWAAGDERCGWLTVCEPCGVQVQFVLDPEMTTLRREGAW